MTHNLFVFIFFFLFCLVVLFLWRAEYLTSKKMLEIIGVFILFPIIIGIIDRFYAKGLWQNFIAGSDPMIWIARGAYGFMIAAVTLKTNPILPIVSGIFLFIIVIMLASEARPSKKTISEGPTQEEKNVLVTKNGNNMPVTVKKIIYLPTDLFVKDSVKIVFHSADDNVTIQPAGCRWGFYHVTNIHVEQIGEDGSILSSKIYSPDVEEMDLPRNGTVILRPAGAVSPGRPVTIFVKRHS